jgi:diketogulonate reductase-like aldo/keto reductase
VIRSLAEKHSCTPEQAVYRVAQLQNVTPLAGTTDEAHMRGALAVEHLAIDLSDKDVLEAGRIVTGLQSVS